MLQIQGRLFFVLSNGPHFVQSYISYLNQWLNKITLVKSAVYVISYSSIAVSQKQKLNVGIVTLLEYVFKVCI